MIYAAAGYRVFIYDIEPSQVEKALSGTKQQLQLLEKEGNLRGKLSAEKQFALIKGML